MCVFLFSSSLTHLTPKRWYFLRYRILKVVLSVRSINEISKFNQYEAKNWVKAQSFNLHFLVSFLENTVNLAILNYFLFWLFYWLSQGLLHFLNLQILSAFDRFAQLCSVNFWLFIILHVLNFRSWGHPLRWMDRRWSLRVTIRLLMNHLWLLRLTNAAAWCSSPFGGSAAHIYCINI